MQFCHWLARTPVRQARKLQIRVGHAVIRKRGHGATSLNQVFEIEPRGKTSRWHRELDVRSLGKVGPSCREFGRNIPRLVGFIPRGPRCGKSISPGDFDARQTTLSNGQFWPATVDHFSASNPETGHSVSVVYGIATCPYVLAFACLKH